MKNSGLANQPQTEAQKETFRKQMKDSHIFVKNSGGDDWEKSFDFNFPNAALDDMQRAYLRNIKEYIRKTIEAERKKVVEEIKKYVIETSTGYVLLKSDLDLDSLLSEEDSKDE